VNQGKNCRGRVGENVKKCDRFPGWAHGGAKGQSGGLGGGFCVHGVS